MEDVQQASNSLQAAGLGVLMPPTPEAIAQQRAAMERYEAERKAALAAQAETEMQKLRAGALEAALRICGPAGTSRTVLSDAAAFLAFLQGDTQ